MALVIDGISVNMNVKQDASKGSLMSETMQFLSANKPFLLHGSQHKGLLVIPGKMVMYDRDNAQLTVCENPSQFQWILQCAMIIYDCVSEIGLIQIPDNVKIYLE